MKNSNLSSDVVTRALLSKAVAERVATAVFSAIGDALARHESVTIAEFRTFSTKTRLVHQPATPRTGESITKPASKTPSFKTGKTLREALN